MGKYERFIMQIYKSPVLISRRIRGRKNLLLERAFLDDLLGFDSRPARPIPDPKGDIYMLDDEQLNAYFEFRKSLRKRG